METRRRIGLLYSLGRQAIFFWYLLINLYQCLEPSPVSLLVFWFVEEVRDESACSHVTMFVAGHRFEFLDRRN